jgi:hypothetical protein
MLNLAWKREDLISAASSVTRLESEQNVFQKNKEKRKTATRVPNGTGSVDRVFR